MKGLRFVSIAIGLAVVLLAFSACEEKEILKRIEKKSKSLQSLRADITMENFNSQLNESDIFKGKLVYIPSKDKFWLRVDWIKPVEESLFMINKNVFLYRPRLNMAYQGSIESTKLPQNKSTSINDALAVFRFSKEYLTTNYNYKYLGEEKINNGVSTWHLEFTPKTARDYKTVEIWVDREGILNQVKVIQRNNDSTKISFTNIEKNVVVKGAEFVPKYPKTTKIVKF